MLDADVHSAILAKARQRKAPKLTLNVNLIEARNLTPMDPNGLADPFVTLNFDKDDSRSFRSSSKTETLNPHFDELFSM